MNKKSIGIIILTRDEPKNLNQTIDAIQKRTNYPFELFIVDNNSNTMEQLSLINEISEKNIATVIRNPKNNWVLGFNLAISLVNRRDDLSKDYIVLTDGDIEVPKTQDNICWLSYLKSELDNNVSIGKLGLPISLENLDKKKFYSIREKEKLLMQGPKIGNSVVSGVDTTLAIYRFDLYVMPFFKIFPGHSSLIKPNYYVCRASNFFIKHLGWDSYNSNENKEKLEEKIICFAKYAGFVEPALLRKVSSSTRAYYLIFGRIVKFFWGLRIIFYWLIFLIIRFPRNINEIQASSRDKINEKEKST